MIMKISWAVPTVLSAVLCVQAVPHTRAEKPAAFFLAGDSTTAIQIAVNGGGVYTVSVLEFNF